MQNLADTLLEQAQALSTLELVAVLMALMYLVLAIRQNIACWIAMGGSAALYVYLFFDAKLYMQSALNAFYFAMAIYGWRVWRSGRQDENHLPVTRWPISTHRYAVVAIAVAAGINAYLLDALTDGEYPYVDAAIAWAAIWTTFLVARKVLENWWYWLVIDVASIFIYWSQDLQLTSVLFALYVIMIPFGLFSWTRSWKEQQE
jgi:nicotinamide mononucleotide transporter